MSEFQAAVLIAQLRRMPEQQARRTAAAAYLDAALATIPGRRSGQGSRRGHRPQLVHVPLALAGRGRWRPAEGGLRARRSRPRASRSSRGYVPLNRNQAVIDEIRRLGGREPDACPNAERAAADEVMVFALPILMGTTGDLDDVVAAVDKVARSRA